MKSAVTGLQSEKKPRKKGFFKNFRLPARSDPIIILCMFILLLFGTVMIVSIQNGTGAESVALSLDGQDLSRTESLAQGLVTSSVLSTIVKQFAFIFIGYVTITLLARMFTFERWAIWKVNAIPILFAALLAPIAIGTEISGSRAWITIGGIFFQPSELVKPATIVIYAYAVHRAVRRAKQNEPVTFSKIYKGPLLFTFLAAAIIILQKDFGTLIIVLGITVICLLIPSLSILKKFQRWLVLLITSGAIVAGGLLVFSDFTSNFFSQIPYLSHIATRIDNMKNPYLDIYGDGYQPANSLYGIGDAGLFGKGLGNSIRKYGYLTQSESDYILSVIIEETGLIGLSVIVICSMIIIIRLFHYALKTKSEADKVIFAASAAYILLHFLINIGGVGGLIPMTGVPLLFISSGGSSLLAICITLGICENRIAHLNRKRRKA